MACWTRKAKLSGRRWEPLDLAGSCRCVRGKVIDLVLAATDRVAAEAEVRTMCDRLLANIVIEKYTVEIV